MRQRCIYCLEVKSVDAFNREHVIPRAFGTFSNNLVLRCVCQSCNAYFSQSLDLRLGRDTLEGLARFQFGLKDASEFRSLGSRSTLSVRATDPRFRGMRLRFTPGEGQEGPPVEPVRQVGFANARDGPYTYFDEASIPGPDGIEEYGLRRRPLYIQSWGIADPDELRSILASRGYPQNPEDMTPASPPLVPGEQIATTIAGRLGRPVFRAVAKIAFNYLAWVHEGSAFMPHFNDIRRYIRIGASEWAPRTKVDWAPVIDNDPPEGAYLGHFLTLQWTTAGEVLAQVQLNRRFRYKMVLAEGGFAMPMHHLDSGHFFDLGTKRVRPLGRRSRS
ncbi:MAG: HNH endonuclease [Myxococcota bacterium]